MKPTRESVEGESQSGRSAGAAFLLAQVGAHASSLFAKRLAKLNLAPPHAGILRVLDWTPAITQQALAISLGMVPSRLVALLDDLDTRGLIERRQNSTDRRSHALYLTTKGRTALGVIGRVAREHQQALLAALSENERGELAALLQRIADQQSLTRGVHPGFARLKGHARVQSADES